MKNGWFDDENRAYIHYTVENIMEDLGCARATCAKVLAELDSKKGIGLIEKKGRDWESRTSYMSKTLSYQSRPQVGKAQRKNPQTLIFPQKFRN